MSIPRDELRRASPSGPDSPETAVGAAREEPATDGASGPGPAVHVGEVERKDASALSPEELIAALEGLRARSARPASWRELIEVGLVHESKSVRRAACSVMLRLGESSAGFLALCASAIERWGGDDNMKALLVLKRAGVASRPFVPVLARVIRDANGAARRAAMKAIGACDDVAGIAVLKSVIRTAPAGDRHAAVGAMVWVEDQSPEATRVLVDLLTDEDDFLALRAAEVLGSLGAPGDPEVALPALARYVRASAGSWTRKQAGMVSVGHILSRARERGLDVLQEFLREEDGSLRAVACVALGVLADEREQARALLFEALEDPDPWVRREAVSALLTARERAEVRDRLRALAEYPDEKVRKAALDALDGGAGKADARCDSRR